MADWVGGDNRIYVDNMSDFANPDCVPCGGVGYVVDRTRLVVSSHGDLQSVYVVPCQTCIVGVWG